MILLSQQINRRINFKDLFSCNSLPIFILSQVSKSNLNFFCKRLLLNISKDNKLIKINKLNCLKENQTFLSFRYNRNWILDYFINKIYNSHKLTTQIYNTLNINSNGFDSTIKSVKFNSYNLKKMTPTCVLRNIKSTLPSNFISNADRSLEESTSNSNHPLNNNIINNNNNSNTNSNTNEDNSNNKSKDIDNDKDSPLSSLNPVLNRRIYKGDSDTDDKSSNDSSVNETYLSDETESRLSRFWYYPSSPMATPRRFSDSSSSHHLKNLNFKSFKVMSFNTLAQSLVDYKYLENDQSTMSWCKRRNEILKVVSDADSEVVCLQELDELDYINFFKDKFEKLGYECVYKRKLQNRLDGILTMYKKDRYELITKNELNFSCDHDQYDKPQVGLIVALRDLYSNKTEGFSNKNLEKESLGSSDGETTSLKDGSEYEVDNRNGRTKDNSIGDMDENSSDGREEKPLEDVLLVTNTHLIFNKSRGDIKLYQLLRLLSGVKETWESVVNYLNNDRKKDNSNKENKDNKEVEQDNGEQQYLEPNILICGDFNITPQSLVYNLLFKGFAPLKNSNPRFLSGQYLMFDQTYLTSSSGHNESGETLGDIKHYVGDVYSDYVHFTNYHSNDTTAACSLKSYTSLDVQSSSATFFSNKDNSGGDNSSCSGNDVIGDYKEDNNEEIMNEKEIKENSLVTRIKALDVSQDVYVNGPFSSDWYNDVLKEVKKEDFVVKPKFVDERNLEEFLDLVEQYSDKNVTDSNESNGLVENFRSKLNLVKNGNDRDGSNNNKNSSNNKVRISESDVIYCPFKLKSAYSADDGFNCEPAFTAYHGWQKGCVDYICYNPDHTLLEGIYEMPLYTKVKESGDLPHKKCPASDHFSLVSQFRRFR